MLAAESESATVSIMRHRPLGWGRRYRGGKRTEACGTRLRVVKTIGTLVAALVCVGVLVAPSAGGGQSWRALRMSRLGAAIDLPASWQGFRPPSPPLPRP